MYNKHFNKEIESFNIQDPNSTHANTALRIKEMYPKHDYYNAFDCFGAKVGIEFHIQQVFDKTGIKIIGYEPMIIYKPNNLLDRNSNEEFQLFKKEKECIEFIAKEILYRYSRVIDCF